MADKNVFCGECGEENEPAFEYCKNCGAPLKREEPINSEYVGAEYQNNNGYGYSAPIESIDGIKSDEIALFVGRKAPVILPKLTNMEMSGSKISWCWPVAVLSFFFGPLGAALWFFYRKMYKWAWCLVAFGFLTTLFVTVLRGDTVSLGQMIESFTDGKIALNELYTITSDWRFLLSETIDDVVNLASAILLGMFSFSIYKNFATSKIREYREKNSDPRYYRMGLSVVGGTSSGMVWVGILCMTLSDIVISNIVSLIKLF
ncbi:MAG: zinc ribbon domain-containing protein [Clostridia bacterium]|nr:zinc ribbon domain-containing protein [Clostridia bacterium]